MDYPSPMPASRTTATVAVFVALVVGSNYALTQFPDAKLDGVMVFISTIAFGVGAGSAIAILSELIWSQFSPWGAAGASLLVFLLSAELLYVLAGYGAGRLAKRMGGGMAERGALFGGLMVVSTLAWDFWTNFGTALLYYGTGLNLAGLLVTEFNPPALLFDLVHEATNLLLGFFVAPAVADVITKRFARNYRLAVGGGG